MSDTPTIEEAFEEASSTLKETGDAKAEPDNQSNLTGETQETPDKESQEKTPLDKFDPDKLPPELRQIHKEMQKGFTQGRQKDREEVNQLKEQIAQLQKQVNPEPEWDALTPEQKIEKYAQHKVLEAKLADFRTQALADYAKIDKRLDESEDNEDYDKIMDIAVSSYLDRELDKHIEEAGNELGFDYQKHAQEFIEAWDQYKRDYVDQFLARQRDLTKKTESRSGKFNPRSVSTPATTPTGSMSFEQAFAAAKEKMA